MAGQFWWKAGSGGNACMEIRSYRPLGKCTSPYPWTYRSIFGLPGSVSVIILGKGHISQSIGER